MDNQQTYKTVSEFDRLYAAVMDLPDVTKCKSATVVATTPLIGAVQTLFGEPRGWPLKIGRWLDRQARKPNYDYDEDDPAFENVVRAWEDG